MIVIRLLFSLVEFRNGKAPSDKNPAPFPLASLCFSRRILPVYASGGKSLKARAPVLWGLFVSAGAKLPREIVGSPGQAVIISFRFMIFPDFGWVAVCWPPGLSIRPMTRPARPVWSVAIAGAGSPVNWSWLARCTAA